jgi:hypothetical protein
VRKTAEVSCSCSVNLRPHPLLILRIIWHTPPFSDRIHKTTYSVYRLPRKLTRAIDHETCKYKDFYNEVCDLLSPRISQFFAIMNVLAHLIAKNPANRFLLNALKITPIFHVCCIQLLLGRPCMGVGWIHVARDNGHYRAVMNTAMNFRIS